jgi:hypothetical protein
LRLRRRRWRRLRSDWLLDLWRNDRRRRHYRRRRRNDDLRLGYRRSFFDLRFDYRFSLHFFGFGLRFDSWGFHFHRGGLGRSHGFFNFGYVDSDDVVEIRSCFTRGFRSIYS